MIYDSASTTDASPFLFPQLIPPSEIQLAFEWVTTLQIKKRFAMIAPRRTTVFPCVKRQHFEDDAAHSYPVCVR